MQMQQYPKGAESLLVALQTPMFSGAVGIPTLLWGKPGEGKSSFIEGLARPGFPVLTIIASIHDPTDFSGLPIAKGDKVHYAIPEWVTTFEETGQGILFLDELTTAPPSVQAALLRVVLERKVGFHKLPDGVRIVAAANPPDLMTGGWELTPPLRNRFLHVQWSLDTATYKNALIDGYAKAVLPAIDPIKHTAALQHYRLLLSGFLSINPNLLSSSPDENRFGFASPRSWDMALSLAASASIMGLDPVHNPTAQSTVFVELLVGCLGEGIATNFLSYLRNTKLPDPLQVLEGKIKLSVQDLNDSELYVLFQSFRTHLNLDVPDVQIAKWYPAFMQLIDEVVATNRKDMVFPAIRTIAKNQQLFSRLLKLNVGLPAEEQERLKKWVFAFFGDRAFNDYVNTL
jgi:AAA domain (dynein-related subfamily)